MKPIKIIHNGFSITLEDLNKELSILLTDEYYFVGKHIIYTVREFKKQVESGAVELAVIQGALYLLQEYNFDIKFIVGN